MKPLSRRTLLRGAGAALALPFLDAMRPARSSQLAAPQRVLVVYRPHGCIPSAWVPASTGADWQLSPILAPLERHRERLLVVSGTHNVPAARFVGSEMPHDQAAMGVLSGQDHTAAIATSPHGGRSFDQIIAPSLQGSAPLTGLYLSSEGTVPCPGPCFFNRTVFYSGLGAPVLPVINPAAAWQAALGTPAYLESQAARERRLNDRVTVVDRVAEDARRLAGRVGAADRARLDQWLTDLHGVQQQAIDQLNGAVCTGDASDWELLNGDLSDAEVNTRFMLELTLMALQCDRARLVGYMMGVEVSARVFPRQGTWATSHFLSHHEERPDRIEAVNQLHTWEYDQVAWLLDRLQALPGEEGGSMLDHTLVVVISGMGDPNPHDLTELPLVLAGGGASLFDPGRHVRAVGVPIHDVLSEVGEALGVPMGPLGMIGGGPSSVLRR